MDAKNTVDILPLYVCTGLSILIILARFLLRWLRGVLFKSNCDYFSVAAAVCIIARLPLMHMIFLWGTNVVPSASLKQINFTNEEIYRREVGSKLELSERMLYAI